MPPKLTSEVAQTLQAYISRKLSLDAIDDWLCGVAYDAALPQEVRDTLAGIRLVVIEAGEGLRTLEEVEQTISDILRDSAAPSPRTTAA